MFRKYLDTICYFLSSQKISGTFPSLLIIIIGDLIHTDKLDKENRYERGNQIHLVFNEKLFLNRHKFRMIHKDNVWHLVGKL